MPDYLGVAKCVATPLIDRKALMNKAEIPYFWGERNVFLKLISLSSRIARKPLLHKAPRPFGPLATLLATLPPVEAHA